MKDHSPRVQKNIYDVLELFEKEVLPCISKGKQEYIETSQSDFWFFFKHYLPHYTEGKALDFHKEIIELLESESKRIVLTAPRGFTKSTLVSFAYVVWNILREQYKFIVIVSATDALAEDLVDFIRLKFSDNKRILEDFSQLLHGIGEKGNVIINKTRILARRRKTATRGFKNRQH